MKRPIDTLEAVTRRRVSESKDRATLSMLDAHGLAAEPRDDDSYAVAGRFILWPLTGFWRAMDGTAQGYGVASLARVAKEAT